MQIRIVRGAKSDEDVTGNLASQLFEVLATMDLFPLVRVIRLVCNLHHRIWVFRGHGADATDVRGKVDIDQCSVDQRHNFDVQSVA